MYGYAFRRALRYRAESWHVGRGQTHEVREHIFEATQLRVKGHTEVKLLRNAVWPPNLVKLLTKM